MLGIDICTHPTFSFPQFFMLSSPFSIEHFYHCRLQGEILPYSRSVLVPSPENRPCWASAQRFSCRRGQWPWWSIYSPCTLRTIPPSHLISSHLICIATINPPLPSQIYKTLKDKPPPPNCSTKQCPGGTTVPTAQHHPRRLHLHPAP